MDTKGIVFLYHLQIVFHSEVPLWAIFEILTMGNLGYLLSCLTIDMREKVSRAIGINLSRDTYRDLFYKYVFALKDLRNDYALSVKHDVSSITIHPDLASRMDLLKNSI